ncbi:MAG: hypothetical protein ACFE96_01800 [Candidatus Hermodarchaeota archaeon]
MIEVYNYRFKKDRIDGYIDGKEYLNRKKKIKAYLEGHNFYQGVDLLLVLREDGVITYSDGDEQGRLEDGKIFTYQGGGLLYEFLKEEGKILDSDGNILLELKGNTSDLDDLDFFGIAAYFLELFA